MDCRVPPSLRQTRPMNDWGWNPASFEAIGTVSASIVATAGLLVSMVVLRRERLDKRRAQANMVAIADVTFRPGKRTEPATWRPLSDGNFEEVPGADFEVQVVRFRLANGSDQPVSYLELVVWIEDQSQWRHYAERRIGDAAIVTDEDPLSTFTDPSAPNGLLTGRHRRWPDVLLAKSSLELSFEVTRLDRYIGKTDFGVVFFDRLGKMWTIRGDSVLLEGRRLATAEIERV